MNDPFDGKYRYFNPHSAAAYPLYGRLSPRKAKTLFPKLYNFWGQLKPAPYESDYIRYWSEFLWKSDSSCAVVIDLNPCRIACYSGEMDAVVMLEFSQRVVHRFNLREDDELICIHAYSNREPDADLVFGEDCSGDFTAIKTIIADFLTDDQDQLRRRKLEIPEATWRRTLAMGKLMNHAFPSLRRVFEDDGTTGWSVLKNPGAYRFRTNPTSLELLREEKPIAQITL